MSKLLATLILAGLPLASAFAQYEPAFRVFFFGSLADDRTTRPSGLNSACWSDRTTGGTGALVDYTTPVAIVLQTGFHYLGTHRNKHCTPEMELRTSVIPFTVGYAIPLGSRIIVTPKLGLAYMVVDGDFGNQSDHDSSVRPTYGISIEGFLTRHWGLRGEVSRYTGRTSLFGLGEFQQDFRVVSFGGAFRW